MSTATRSAASLRPGAITVPAQYVRTDYLVEDDALRKSIQVTGIQQPLVVLRYGTASRPLRFELIDGFRRLQIARELAIEEVPVIVVAVPEDEDPDRYRDRLRFIIDEHRQDLFPSQRAELIMKLKEMFGLKNKEVALMLGIDPGSITNWLAITKYAPEIAKDIDTGRLNSHAARSFDGMTPAAQLKIYRGHKKEFQTLPGHKLHKLIRSQYPPATFPDYYVNPDITQSKLAIKKAGRKTTKRPSISAHDKKRLSRDLALQETELRDSKEELETFRREINTAAPIINAIMRHPDLVSMLTDDQRDEFARFVEIY